MKLNIKRDSYTPSIVKMPQKVCITTRNQSPKFKRLAFNMLESCGLHR